MGLLVVAVPDHAAGLVRRRHARSRRGWTRIRGATLGTLHAMVRDWPFFRAVLANMSMVLAKTDLAIGVALRELATERGLRERIWPHRR